MRRKMHVDYTNGIADWRIACERRIEHARRVLIASVDTWSFPLLLNPAIFSAVAKVQTGTRFRFRNDESTAQCIMPVGTDLL